MRGLPRRVGWLSYPTRGGNPLMDRKWHRQDVDRGKGVGNDDQAPQQREIKLGRRRRTRELVRRAGLSSRFSLPLLGCFVRPGPVAPPPGRWLRRCRSGPMTGLPPRVRWPLYPTRGGSPLMDRELYRITRRPGEGDRSRKTTHPQRGSQNRFDEPARQTRTGHLIRHRMGTLLTLSANPSTRENNTRRATRHSSSKG